MVLPTCDNWWLLVDMDAAVFHHPECFASAIDNKLQVAAHAYSDEVLEVAQQQNQLQNLNAQKVSLLMTGN